MDRCIKGGRIDEHKRFRNVIENIQANRYWYLGLAMRHRVSTPSGAVEIDWKIQRIELTERNGVWISKQSLV